MLTFKQFLAEKKDCGGECIDSYSPTKGGEPYVKLEKVIKDGEEKYVVTCDEEGIKDIFDDENDAREYYDELIDSLDI